MSSLADPRPSLPKRILVGVDASKGSDEAVRAAHALGAQLGVPVELVHALPLPDYRRIGFEPERSEEIARRIRERAQDELDAHHATSGPREGVVRLVAGRAADVLAAEARAGGALLFVGRHGRRGLFDMGNTVRSVLLRSTVPVWVHRGSTRDVAEILAPIDGSAESLRALTYACTLAKRLGARVRALYCFDALAWAMWADPATEIFIERVRDAERAQVEASIREFDWLGAQHTFEIVDAEPVSHIVELSRAADLVVLGTHGTGGLAAVLGSVAFGVVRAAHCPVVVVPHPAARGPA